MVGMEWPLVGRDTPNHTLGLRCRATLCTVGVMTPTYIQTTDWNLVIWMAEMRAAEVLNELRETTVADYADTMCAVCECKLPAGATAYVDADSVLCVDCAEVELTAAGKSV